MTHLGTGKLVDKKDIPHWKGKPKGQGPFERTACGVYVKPKHTLTCRPGVDCNSCKRTQAYREAPRVQTPPTP